MLICHKPGPGKMINRKFLLRLLKRGHTSRVVQKVLGENFKRVFKEIWTA